MKKRENDLATDLSVVLCNGILVVHVLLLKLYKYTKQ